MSKSNTDFSAFDFNDSSDNSDITSRTPFLNRTNLSNNNSNCSIKINVNNNNNNNNTNMNNHNNNSNSQHSHQSNTSRKSRASSSSSTSSSASSSSNSSSSNDNDMNNKKRSETTLQKNLNEHLTDAPISNGQRAANDNSSRNDNQIRGDDDDEDDDDEEDDDDDDDEDDLSSHNQHHRNNSSRGKTNNSNSHGNSNNIRADGLLIGTALRRDNNGCSNLDPNNTACGSGADGAANTVGNNNNLIANSMQAAAAAVAAVAAVAASSAVNDSSGHNVNPGLGMASGTLNCSEFTRSSSNSCSTNMGGGAGAGGGGVTNERKKYRHQNYSKNIYIGTKNAEKWELTRSRLRFKNDVEFVAYLLNLADNDPDRIANLPPPSTCTTPTKGFSGSFKLEPNLSVKDFAIKNEVGTVGRKKGKKRVQFSDSMVNGITKMKDFSNFALKAKRHEQKMKTTSNRHNESSANNNGDMLPEVLDCRIAEKIKNELAEKTRSSDILPNVLCLKKGNNYTHDEDDDDAETETDKVAAGTSASNAVDSSQLSPGTFRMRMKNKKVKNILPYTPLQASKVSGSLLSLDEEGDDDEDTGGSEDEELDEDALEREMRSEQNFVEEDDEHDLAFRSQQSCRDCSITHDYKVCPLHNAIGIITDAVDLSEWIERKNLEALAKLKANAQRHTKRSCDDDEDMDDTSQMSDLETKPLITFAEASVPAEFELHNVEPHVTGVFARTDIRAYTKLGPLIGQVIQRDDLTETSNMKWIFEICEPGAEKSQLLCCDSPNTSNWLRYIRPSPTYEERTVNLVSIDRQAFFVTNRDLKNGMELLYWSDDCNTMWRKKQHDKTTCGGCNIQFDHYLYYRTHCSIFHDPTMSLTIRKYHCKVCGDVVLGKDNIMKHAIDIHDGKGAYQCQFCNKYFLRSNYLELHRTYGCSMNPNRTRPLCDFCGRKFCQPQKLKAHIKRVHSGSRAALQRHSKEVHSRNSTVVSCPRCQKLFQNRSNLKIHMLTHSGVRPFKCAESECNAAFTTKQCLQFHYKKVHNYTQEQMPKIERSVAYTFDAYSGGMKVDFLEQAPRRRRKSLEDQNSMLSSSIQSDTEFSDDNIFEAIKKSGKSIKDLCRNEPNLSLLSSKISSIFGEKVVGSRKRKKKKDLNNSLLASQEGEEDDHLEHVRRKQNAQLSLVETFLTTTAQRLQQQQVQQVVAAAAAMAATSVSDDPTKMHNMMPGLNAQHMGLGHASVMNHEEDDDEDEDEDEISRHNTSTDAHHDSSSFRHHSGLNSHGHNLVVSKGSKKWISGDDRHLPTNDRCNEIVNNSANTANAAALVGQSGSCNLPVNNQNTEIGLPAFAVPSTNVDNTNKLIGQNRDFLARLMNSASGNHAHHNTCNREEDENTSFLDVVESNNNPANAQISQYHHNNNSSVNTASSSNANNPSTVTDANTTNPQSLNNSDMQMTSLSHTQSFMSSFYNNANARMSGAGSSASTSASMLVEAALNSVGNMIDSENADLKVPTDNNINSDSPMSSHVDSDSNRYANASNNSAMNSMENLEKELSMMKNLSNFPMPPLPMFPNSANDINSCLSPNASTPTNSQSNQNQLNNDVEVDSGSTPRQQNASANTGDSDRFSASHHRTPPSPQPISPGRDYSMFGATAANSGNSSGGPGGAGGSGSGNSTAPTNVANNISASSPLQALQPQRRTGSSVSSNYPEHELISPASSPSIPRYNFNDELLRHKRAEVENERRQNITHNQISSDEENSLMPQNSVTGQDMRLKFSQPQMDLMYSKYESMTNATNLKYNNHVLDSPAEYRSNNTNSAVSATGTSNDLSDLQGLDMSSRSGVSTSSNYHHNFQLPSSAATNLPSIGRYHHHIYDILSEREQNQQSQAQSAQQHHSSVAAAAAAAAQHQEHSSQLQAMQHQTTMHNMLSDQLSEQEHDQATSVDLSRTANYVVPSPPQLPYNHPHHDMLRMASLDLTPNTNMSVGNNRSFLPSQMQHQSRESLEHHRLLSTVEQHRILAASNAADQHRLLVDPTAHLLMEQNNRLLGTDQSRLLGESTQNRHMARGFGAYHQVASGNYHHGVRPPVLPSPNHHASNPSNYHPFPAYY